MNLTFILILVGLAYIVVVAARYCFMHSLAAIAMVGVWIVLYQQGGPGALTAGFFLTPVFWVMIQDMLESRRLPPAVPAPVVSADEDDAPPVAESALRGEWIDGKAKSITRQQPLIGDVKALSSWL
ncbi:MAG TPA: hypothetical protein ENK53_05605 [Thiotrichales bacterium]|nr:hypothetical protein [Thiotrichales bacterium]